MKSRTLTATGTDRIRGLLAVLALATIGAAAGCVPEEEAAAGEQGAVTQIEQSLMRGSGPRGLGYSCSNGTCTCDKSIENDCADMSAVCTDATVDALIACINGWLTTHCVCTQAMAAPPKPKTPIVRPPTTATMTSMKAS